MNVQANCTWTLSEKSREVLIEEMQGSGNCQIRINVANNLTHGELSHVVIITSEDGISSHTLSIIQEPALFIEAENPEKLSSNEGEFTVSVRTNIENPEIEYPEWIDLQTKEYICDTITNYVFSYSENNLDKDRTGKILFSHEHVYKVVNIVQSVILIEKIEIQGWSNLLFSSKSTFPIVYEPKKALISSLSAFSDDENICKVWIDNGNLELRSSNYGKCNIFVKQNERNVFEEELEIYPKYIHIENPEEDSVLIGTIVPVSVNYPDYLYELSTSDGNIIEIIDGKNVKISKEGQATVVATCPENKSSDSILLKGIKHKLTAFETEFERTYDVVDAKIKIILESCENTEVLDVKVSYAGEVLTTTANCQIDGNGTKFIEIYTDEVTFEDIYPHTFYSMWGVYVKVTIKTNNGPYILSYSFG